MSMAPRTLLITPYFDAAAPSGGVLFSIDVVREWLARGREVVVLCAERERSLHDLAPYVETGRLRLHEVGSPHQVRFTHHDHARVYERARAAMQAVSPEVIHIHNTQGMFAAIRAALDWRGDQTMERSDVEDPTGAPGRCRVLLTSLDFGLLCFNHYLYDQSEQPCGGPASPRQCARCVRRTIRGPARWAGWMLPRVLTRRWWPDFVRLDQAQCAAELHALMRGILRRLDVIIAPSPIMADQMRAAAGTGVTVHRTVYGVSPAKMRRPAKTRSDRVRLAFLGSAEPVKGLHVLMAAAQRLPDGLPLEIRTIGNESVQRMIAEASTGARRYLSHMPALLGTALAEAHARIDAVLAPSLWHENSPFVVLESLANGTPVIASDQAGIRHLITPGKTGWLVRPGCVDAWTAVLERCAREPATLARMGAAAEFTRTTADFVTDIEPLEGADSAAGRLVRAVHAREQRVEVGGVDIEVPVEVGRLTAG